MSKIKNILTPAGYKNIGVSDLVGSVFSIVNDTNSSQQLAFLIGAGASIQSKIPGGGTMAVDWFSKLKTDAGKTDASIQAWLNAPEDDGNEYPKKLLLNYLETTLENLPTEIFAAYYSRICEFYYEANEDRLNEYLLAQVTNREPSDGYKILAALLAHPKSKVAITTNFDRLIAKAFSDTTGKNDLYDIVSLSAIPKRMIHRSQSVLAKVHHDILHDPKNLEKNLNRLEPKWKKYLNSIVQGKKLIVIGYGGHDKGLMDFLINNRNLHKNIYWCVLEGSEPNKKVKELLEKQNGYLVKINGFDELMKSVNEKLNITKRNETKDDLKPEIRQQTKPSEALAPAHADDNTSDSDGHRIVVEALKKRTVNKKLEALMKRLTAYPKSYHINATIAYLVQFELGEEKLPIDVYYADALKNAPPQSIGLKSNYASYLYEVKKDYKAAKKIFQELYANKAHYNDKHELAIMIANYALFTDRVNNDSKLAEELYKEALSLRKDDPLLNLYLGIFLHLKGIDNYEEAKKYYNTSLLKDNRNAITNGNYAQILLAEGKKKEAEKMLRIAERECRNNPSLALELAFYRYAHYPWFHRIRAKRRIERLLHSGVKSVGWNLSRNIKQARKDGHPKLLELEKFAQAITANY